MTYSNPDIYCNRCNVSYIENKETKLCASCSALIRKAERMEAKGKKPVKPIPKASDKTSKKIGEYSRLKKEFIIGKICPIYPNLPVTEVHHRKGRTGHLLLDTNFWLAVSRKGHMKIELNPKWAREMGYSLTRQ